MIDAIFMTVALALPTDPVAHASGMRPQHTRLSREASAAHSSRGHDMRGELPSMYRGKYYRSSQESFRRCVAEREGMFHYDVQGGGGNSYYGTYQFSWRFQNGVPYMMAKESRKTHDGLADEALALRHKRINQWSRYWQDRAFYTVLNFNGDWAGKAHWAGGRWHC